MNRHNSPMNRQMISLPNLLTWLRLFSAPLLVAVFYHADFFSGGERWRDLALALLFLAAMATDFLDGFLARRFNAGSRFGEFLDPVADKIVVTTALLLLLFEDRAPLVATLIIVCREICVSALREWMATIGERRRVNVSLLGKWKTGIQTAAIALLLYGEDLFGVPLVQGGLFLLWTAAALTLWSMFVYLLAARNLFSPKNKIENENEIENKNKNQNQNGENKNEKQNKNGGGNL